MERPMWTVVVCAGWSKEANKREVCGAWPGERRVARLSPTSLRREAGRPRARPGRTDHAAAAGFPVLDLDLVYRFLSAFDEKVLWVAVGGFLERHRRSFSVSDSFLTRLERHRPRSRVHLARGDGRGRLASRWNLILPEALVSGGEPDER